MPIFGKLSERIDQSIRNHRLKAYIKTLSEVRRLDYSGYSDADLLRQSLELRERANAGETTQELLVPAFALVAEVSERKLGLVPFDTQLLAGAALADRKLAEMQTGEGKTLAAVFAVYLHALCGQGVHVFTFNDYLAERDARWMSPVYAALGLTVSSVQADMSPESRRTAYSADVTYVTAKEAGFDYLRDGLARKPEDLLHRALHFVLVDEADSILIDEARVPLVIAGEKPAEANPSARMAAIAAQLEADADYDTDEFKRNVFLTDEGAQKAERLLGIESLYASEHLAELTGLNCALHAKVLLVRDVDYIVREGRAEQVDSATGRVAENRRWPDGLQAAVEAKEGLEPQTRGQVLGTIPLQHYLSLYPSMAGMTGTALTSADEFKETYSLDVVVIPPHRSNIREDMPPLIYTHPDSKRNAIVQKVLDIHRSGRPVLLGTASVEESEQLAVRLEEAAVPCRVLNARNDKEEAGIIARAGELGAVTVSTNMAGRGVDILLGGGREVEYAQVKALGGLYVIGTHLHESLRIDNQLRGRAGRQGDPGTTQFMVSLEDDLLVRYGLKDELPDNMTGLRQAEPVNTPALERKLTHIQRVANGHQFEARKNLNSYSDTLEEQRRIFRKEREDVLFDRVISSPLSVFDPACYERLLSILGEDTLRKIEKIAALHYMDKVWTDHLDYMNYLKESVHLSSISNRNPLDEFNVNLIRSFTDLPGRVEDQTVQYLQRLRPTSAFDPERDGPKQSTSTWTYAVNDLFLLTRRSIFD
ncbi:accessory Sec system translocase SecA2 [Gorillibacterium timonense]|uniref:accessory Sec system translocase SecA2 n=1 Tax=Gorillibacterium timonense TaxID=1689269 RepID=UPI00071DC744|nr:accessory Sec system translocase SecA2 [Gorillibacterium timonense]